MEKKSLSHYIVNMHHIDGKIFFFCLVLHVMSGNTTYNYLVCYFSSNFQFTELSKYSTSIFHALSRFNIFKYDKVQVNLTVEKVTNTCCYLLTKEGGSCFFRSCIMLTFKLNQVHIWENYLSNIKCYSEQALYDVLDLLSIKMWECSGQV